MDDIGQLAICVDRRSGCRHYDDEVDDHQHDADDFQHDPSDQAGDGPTLCRSRCSLGRYHVATCIVRTNLRNGDKTKTLIFCTLKIKFDSEKNTH